MAKNNPIQNRIDQLLQRWQIAINTPGINIVRFYAEPDEEEMIDTFFEYLLALDVDIDDFVMVFESFFDDKENFSKILIQEFKEELDTWNEVEKPESIVYDNIDWKPNYNTTLKDNSAALFVNNINTFIDKVCPNKDLKFCFIIKMPNATSDMAYKWLNDLLKCDIASNIIIGITDTTEFPIYNKITAKHPEKILTLQPDLNMDQAVEQLAAQAGTATPENAYRSMFVKLMNAVKQREARKAQRYAKECLKIAVKEIETNKNWLTQIVAVYTTLYSDQIGYKNYNDAIYFADKAVEAAMACNGNIEPDVAFRLIGQTHLGRGSLHFINKDKNKALADYTMASRAYGACNDVLMRCEALRLAGDMNEKLHDVDKALECYLEAYQLKNKLTPDLVKGSTFPYIVKRLLKLHQRKALLPDSQLHDDMQPIFGDDWKDIILDYGNYKKAS